MLEVDPPSTVHGRSFWDLARGDGTGSRDYVITGWRQRKYYYVVDDEWRYVDNGPAGPCELYNKERDPAEEDDVARENPDICDLMERRLEEFWDQARQLSP
jgi:arylsulfatase A-like enzyme